MYTHNIAQTKYARISNLFSEMIAVWIISTWEILNKPKNITRNIDDNIIRLII